MNELELGIVIKSRALLTEQLCGGLWEKSLKGREKGYEKFLSLFLSGEQCTIECSGKSAEPLHFTRSVVLKPFIFCCHYIEPVHMCVSLRPSSSHPAMVKVIGVFTGEVLQRHFPFYVQYVELLVKEEGQTNGRYHSVISPLSFNEI